MNNHYEKYVHGKIATIYFGSKVEVDNENNKLDLDKIDCLYFSMKLKYRS